MNKFTFALALGAGLVLSLAAPSAQASPVQASTIQDLAPVTMSAAQFNSEFTPINGNSPLSKPFTFINTTDTAGTVQSQVFQGTGKLAGVYAYAYQFDVNPNVKDSTGQPIAVNSTAMYFNATPALANLTNASPSAVYDAWLSVEEHAKMTRGAAVLDARGGGAHSAPRKKAAPRKG